MRAIVVLVVLGGYSWVSAGVAPFTALSYVLVAIPCAALVVGYARMGGLTASRDDIGEFYRASSEDATLVSVVPWTALLLAVVALEVVGLALGGRSASVPTLSTTVDHLLAFRWERGLLCFAWLLVGALPLRRLQRSVGTRGL